MMRTIFVVCLYLLYNTFCFHIYSQSTDGFDIEGGIISSEIDDKISLNIGMSYNYWFNPFLAINIGGIVYYSVIDKKLNSTNYYINDQNIVNLSAISGLKMTSPTFCRVGITGSVDFLFEPIPFNSISIEKEEPINRKQETKSKFVFTHFNPSYSVRVGLFYKLKNISETQITLGYGITNYNIYNTYYRASIDNLNLKEYAILKPNKLSHLIFIRFTGINR